MARAYKSPSGPERAIVTVADGFGRPHPLLGKSQGNPGRPKGKTFVYKPLTKAEQTQIADARRTDAILIQTVPPRNGGRSILVLDCKDYCGGVGMKERWETLKFKGDELVSQVRELVREWSVR